MALFESCICGGCLAAVNPPPLPSPPKSKSKGSYAEELDVVEDADGGRLKSLWGQGGSLNKEILIFKMGFYFSKFRCI